MHVFLQFFTFLREIESMVIVGPKCSVALGTLSLPRLVSRAQTIEAENVETFGQNRVLAGHLARRTCQCVFVLAQLLAEHLIGRTGRLDLLEPLHSAPQLGKFLLFQSNDF